MASSSTDKDNVASSAPKLAIDSSRGAKAKSKKVVVDSWEDEDVSDQDETPEEPESASKPSTPAAPPPTPSSPSYGSNHEWASMTGTPPPSSPGGDAASARRPEKTDAVARRMIAAGLGLKAPKQTEEQKAYQKAIREQEKKKREQERAEEQKQRELTEKAKAAIWDD